MQASVRVLDTEKIHWETKQIHLVTFKELQNTADFFYHKNDQVSNSIFQLSRKLPVCLSHLIVECTT
jgi:hypothetical protein